MQSKQEPDRSPGVQRCPACGREFICGMAAGDQHCWCADLPPVSVPATAPAGCHCPDCLRKMPGKTACSS
ncbi:MAG: cysteine-rich CWC family protein [Pseudomonadota bacterium]